MPAENLFPARRALARGVGARWSVLVLAAALGACAQTAPDAPQLEMFPHATQKQVGALQHWDVVADDVAARLAMRLRDWPQGEHPIYLQTAVAGTFSEAFHALLLTRLLDRGMTISKVPVDVTLKVEVQVIHHGMSRLGVPGTQPVQMRQRLPHGVQVQRGLAEAEISALAAGEQAAGQASPSDAAVQAQAAASAPAGRSIALNTTPTSVAVSAPVAMPAPAVAVAQSEVLITTSLEQVDRYLTRTADLYYVATENAALFEPPPPPPPPPIPTPVKRWQVVAP